MFNDILYQFMGQYELTVVLPGKSSSAKKKVVQERIEKLIKLLSGKINSFLDWGEIPLAYKIKKHTEGVFLHFVVELESKNVKSLSDKLKTEEDIIRILLVKCQKRENTKEKSE
ncbi:MAG: 30S ribosomal protein S6 [Patescibacteria group bacterium]|nr:30S ribosomal protein S6 [Patescibacteria group bacterium]